MQSRVTTATTHEAQRVAGPDEIKTGLLQRRCASQTSQTCRTQRQARTEQRPTASEGQGVGCSKVEAR